MSDESLSGALRALGDFDLGGLILPCDNKDNFSLCRMRCIVRQ